MPSCWRNLLAGPHVSPRSRFELQSIQRFPDVLYLAPERAEPFRELTCAIFGWYPETSHYGGKWPDIVPHLSVASIADRHELARIADELAQAGRDALPIRVIVRDVSLLERRSG